MGKSCSDIDECMLGLDNCSAFATCENTEGLFSCTCDDGFSGPGDACTADDALTTVLTLELTNLTTQLTQLSAEMPSAIAKRVSLIKLAQEAAEEAPEEDLQLVKIAEVLHLGIVDSNETVPSDSQVSVGETANEIMSSVFFQRETRLTEAQATVCGDNTCSTDYETCNSCPSDCGACVTKLGVNSTSLQSQYRKEVFLHGVVQMNITLSEPSGSNTVPQNEVQVVALEEDKLDDTSLPVNLYPSIFQAE